MESSTEVDEKWPGLGGGSLKAWTQEREKIKPRGQGRMRVQKKEPHTSCKGCIEDTLGEGKDGRLAVKKGDNTRRKSPVNLSGHRAPHLTQLSLTSWYHPLL